jgi:hypothetical protein
VQTLASDASAGEKAASFGLFAAGIVAPGGGGSTTLKNMPVSEAKQLMSKWNKGNHYNIAESLRYHADKHGFGGDMPKYLRKAASFNKKGARKTTLSDGATRWNRKSGEFLIERDKKIVSYGKNKK